MAGKLFTDEQKKILSKNPNVEAVESSRIIYTEAFKEYYMQNYLAGKKPTEIFIEAGFDPSILGNKRIERASARWRKLYADGALIIAKDEVDNKEKQEKEEVDMQAKSATKRRGRPRKNVEPVVEKEIIVEEPKKKRGRPRKNTQAVEQVKAVEVKVKATTKAKTKKNVEKTPKKRVNKIALMAQNIKLAETPTKKVSAKSAKVEKVEIVQEPVKQETKRRGRPPKIAKELPVETTETSMQIEPKTQVQEAENLAPKRRGRPRKVVAVENIKKEEKPIKIEANVAVNEQVVTTKEHIIEEKQPIVNEEQMNPVADLVKAINRLTGEVNSLKRLLAGKKKINY